MTREILPVVILCGGQGTRMYGGGAPRPKMLVEVGEWPMLWHLMQIYAHYGHKQFILCLGYLGDQIRRYFLEYEVMHRDVTFRLGAPNGPKYHGQFRELDWEITFADTGAYTQTGARIRKIAPYIKTERFFATYGDGLGDVDLDALLAYHRSKGVIATLTAVRPRSQWGIVEVNAAGIVTGFRQKPHMEAWVNGGFFVFERGIFDYLQGDDALELELEPFERLVRDGQLALYRHDGFWRAMDTFKDVEEVDALWRAGDAPWKVWDQGAAR
ncbi:MAG: glucose-1-phosphate cytidylyltransferase [Anaerolineae bacterium]